jgi:hypothetical protein
MERLEIIVADIGETNSSADIDNTTGLVYLGEQLKNFDINNSHCFDPNEEFKLRQIMYCIGVDRMNDIKDTILLVIQSKIRRFNAWDSFLKMWQIKESESSSTTLPTSDESSA